MLAQAPIEQAQAYAEDDAHDVRDPVVDVRAAPKGGLYKLYGATKCTGSYKHGDQSKAARTCQRKGESCKCNEVYDFITSIWARGRLMDGRKHGHCQNSRHDECQGDVEVLAHANRLTALGTERKWNLSLGGFAAKMKAA